MGAAEPTVRADRPPKPTSRPIFLIFIGKSIFHFFNFLFYYYFNEKYWKFHFLYNSQDILILIRRGATEN